MSKTKEVVKGDNKNFVNKAATADKKPVKKIGKKLNKKPVSETEAPKEKTNDGEPKKPIVKKPLTRAQIAEKKFGVESTWRPFEAYFNKNKKEEETK